MLAETAWVWLALAAVWFALCFRLGHLPGYILGMTGFPGILVARMFDAALTAHDGRATRPVSRATMAFVPGCLLATVAAFGAFGVVTRCRQNALLCFLCFALIVPLGANAGMSMIDMIFGAQLLPSGGP